jgi:hypothetical protein
MVARVAVSKITRGLGRTGQQMAFVEFAIESHDGQFALNIGVPDGEDTAVTQEAQNRLKDVLRDALAELER